MKVFLSWSGKRSKAVAEELGAWLAKVIQAVEPWISSGMEKGARWQSEIAERLDEAKIGIVCLTSSNLTAPWILFEAGALSKTKNSYVCTFLLDVAPADVEPPLGQFQHTVSAREDVLKLVRTINDALKNSGKRPLADEILTNTFNTFWPELETKLTEIRRLHGVRVKPRSERELLEEMLEILRGQEQRVRKEGEEREFYQSFTEKVAAKILGKEAAPSARDVRRLYLDSLQNADEAAIKRWSPPKDLFKQESPSAESSEKSDTA